MKFRFNKIFKQEKCSKMLHNHEVSVNHLQTMLTYHEARRLEMSSSINDYLESACHATIKFYQIKTLHLFKLSV